MKLTRLLEEWTAGNSGFACLPFFDDSEKDELILDLLHAYYNTEYCPVEGATASDRVATVVRRRFALMEDHIQRWLEDNLPVTLVNDIEAEGMR